MSKDAAIAEIVKNLHNLNLEDNNQILQFIKSKKQQSKKGKNKNNKESHIDRDGTPINKGHKVFLLTPGVYNRKGEKGSVHTLPKTVGEYITFKQNRIEKGETYNTYIRKLGTSVRKVPDQHDN